jgi:hypothetical protein
MCHKLPVTRFRTSGVQITLSYLLLTISKEPIIFEYRLLLIFCGIVRQLIVLPNNTRLRRRTLVVYSFPSRWHVVDVWCDGRVCSVLICGLGTTVPQVIG